MSQDQTARLPAGFGGSYERRELFAEHGRTLRLPAQGCAEGPFLQVPEGPFDTILVLGLAESFGNLERFARVLADSLAPGGRLVVDLESVMSLRALRVAVEGKVSALEPFGSLAEPERRVHPSRVLRAVAAAGLLVEDLVSVPSGSERAGARFVAACLEQGFLATPYVARTPAPRLWLLATKAPICAGSVLIGAADPREQERTARAVSAFLPPTWEVLRCPGTRESEGWNRAIVTSRGEALWLLRAGALPDAQLFAQLLAQIVISPAAPGEDGALSAPGDLSGLMLTRLDAFQNGPLGAERANDGVAYEEWLLQLEARGRAPRAIDCAFAGPAPRVADPASLQHEAEALLARWSVIDAPQTARGEPELAVESGDVDASTASSPPSSPPAAGGCVPPWAGREPMISLVMIAKNEQRFLPECLTRASAACDEIVLVDTGSSDDTIAIARSFGARVTSAPWTDDFSAPRNLGLQQARGDWVLVLDADEFLCDGGAERIRELVRAPKISGYHVVFKNVYSGGKTLGVIMVRLFRNLPGLRWQNRIHEQITPSLVAAARADGLTLSICDVEVEHHGYSDEVMTSRGKNERNERLFVLQLAEMPEDIYSLYKFGDFLRRVPERSDAACGWLQKAYDQLTALPPIAATEIPYASEVAALLALELARVDRVSEANAVVDYALRAFIATPNLHYIAAILALAQQRSDEAILHFESCLSYRDQVLVVAIQEGITSYVAIAGIAQALLQKGQRGHARRLLAQARALKPDYDLAAMTLSRIKAEDGDLGGALCELTEFMTVNPKSAGAAQQATLLLARLGEHQRAREIGRHAVALMESNALAHEARRLKEFLVSLS